MYYAALIYKMYMNMNKNKTCVLTPLHFETTCLENDGCLVLKGRFTPEQGVLVKKVLELIMDEDFEEQKDVSTETFLR